MEADPIVIYDMILLHIIVYDTYIICISYLTYHFSFKVNSLQVWKLTQYMYHILNMCVEFTFKSTLKLK